jgi:hypothetical protein
VTLKTLVTGVAAVAVVAAAAGGVTSIASSATPTTPAIQPVVFGVPLPLDPAPQLQPPLLNTLQALGSGGPAASKSAYVQGGIGRIEGRIADSKIQQASAEGKFPLSFSVQNIDQVGDVATADVTATAPTGGTATQNIQFVAGPSPTGWQMSRQSLMALLQSV